LGVAAAASAAAAASSCLRLASSTSSFKIKEFVYYSIKLGIL
jgi:hypothetical protein